MGDSFRCVRRANSALPGWPLYARVVPVSSDVVREERIKRLRALSRAGQAHLVTIHDAVPTYLRRGEAEEAKLDEHFGVPNGFFRSHMSPEHAREFDIALGVKADDDENGTYRRIYKWLSDVISAAPRSLLDARYKEFITLPDPPDITVELIPGADRNVEGQLGALADAIQLRLDIFTAQLRDDGEREDVTPTVRDAASGWPHLRDAVLPSAVLDGYLTRMRRRRTRAEISDSIGAAKEVVEATLKALSMKFGAAPASAKPDLQDWWKVLKPHLANAKVDKALGSTDGALLKLVSAQVSTLQSLGELRNKVGSGHGKTAHPAGLTRAHALLAVDTAHTVTRFLAS